MLTGKQRSYLRGEANELDPVIHIGKDGISESVVEQVEELLEIHELIKGRVLDNAPQGVKNTAYELAEKTDSEVVQVIGNVFIIYREDPEDSNYNL
ncbi:MAG: ribosome assembly RNA-binding protein YhbY [Bacillota bacterium]